MTSATRSATTTTGSISAKKMVKYTAFSIRKIAVFIPNDNTQGGKY